MYSIDDPYLYHHFKVSGKRESNIDLLTRKKKPENIAIYGCIFNCRKDLGHHKSDQRVDTKRSEWKENLFGDAALFVREEDVLHEHKREAGAGRLGDLGLVLFRRRNSGVEVLRNHRQDGHQRHEGVPNRSLFKLIQDLI